MENPVDFRKYDDANMEGLKISIVSLASMMGGRVTHYPASTRVSTSDRNFVLKKNDVTPLLEIETRKRNGWSSVQHRGHAAVSATIQTLMNEVLK